MGRGYIRRGGDGGGASLSAGTATVTASGGAWGHETEVLTRLGGSHPGTPQITLTITEDDLYIPVGLPAGLETKSDVVVCVSGRRGADGLSNGLFYWTVRHNGVIIADSYASTSAGTFWTGTIPVRLVAVGDVITVSMRTANAAHATDLEFYGILPHALSIPGQAIDGSAWLIEKPTVWTTEPAPVPTIIPASGGIWSTTPNLNGWYSRDRRESQAVSGIDRFFQSTPGLQAPGPYVATTGGHLYGTGKGGWHATNRLAEVNNRMTAMSFRYQQLDAVTFP